MAQMDLYYNQDFVCREIPMIPGVHGYVDLDEEGRANVYLNANDPPEEKEKAAKHELIHYVNDDFYNDRDKAEDRVAKMMDKTEIYKIDCGNT